MARIAIIGNGPSRKLYDISQASDYVEYDVKIGCNFSKPSHKVDYRVFADAFAAKRMRPEEDYHNELKNYRLILGERALSSLEQFKARPGDKITLASYILDSGQVESVVRYPEAFRSNQSLFSAGHIAFYWATEKYPDSDFDFFGFDSIFTDDYRSSWSNLLREEPVNVNGKPTFPPGEPTWMTFWQHLFDTQNFRSVVIHGYRTDDMVDRSFGPKVQIRAV